MIWKDRPILYVDDTEEQRYAMCRILDREGYRTVEATTGVEALTMLHSKLLAVVLDVKLPDMSGYEVCRRIKQHALYGSIPVIQVSASFADPDHRAIGLSGGADAYIAQPVHPQELLNLVQSVIRSSHAERMLRFMAQIGPKITKSLELAETIDAVRSSVPPYFADWCEVILRDSGIAQESVVRLEPALDTLVHHAMETSTLQFRVAQERSAIAAPLHVAGRDLGVALFVLDAGERTYTESDLVSAADLADRIALALEHSRLYTAQRTAQAALVQSEKLAAAGRLSAAIAHELNNPLEAITNLLYLIETGEGVPEVTRTFAKEALSELERLSHITRQSLGFYRELTTAQEFDVSENVQETLHLYSRRLASKDIAIDTDYDPSLRAYAIRGEIRQVLSNLIVNALDAMEQGGHMSIRTFRSPAGEVIVCIRDDGPGIPEKIRDRIFEPFFTTKPGTGTGLGLWVSDTIMRKNSGRIELHTEVQGEERGTMMCIVLPDAQTPVASGSTPLILRS